MVRDFRGDPRDEGLKASLTELLDRHVVGRDPRRPVEFRGRTYSLRSSEVAALQQVGTFRIIEVRDLQAVLYGGDRSHAELDLRSLSDQGLIRRHTLVDRQGTRHTVVSLTKTGAALARTTMDDRDQAVYDGFVKPREVAHDAALFRMFAAERQRIERAGGRVLTVTLDYELKRRVYRPTNRPTPSDGSPAPAREDVVRAEGLRIVDGTVQIPDLRIEFEDAAGERGRVDLELATEHYKAGQLAAKARAGFTLYAAPDQTARLSAALEERDLMVEILSL